jgi:hypothetical protein
MSLLFYHGARVCPLYDLVLVRVGGLRITSSLPLETKNCVGRVC